MLYETRQLPASIYSGCRGIGCGDTPTTIILDPVPYLNWELREVQTAIKTCPFHLKQARAAMRKHVLKNKSFAFTPEFVGREVFILRTSGNVDTFKIMHPVFHGDKFSALVIKEDLTKLTKLTKYVTIDEIFERNNMDSKQMMIDFEMYTLNKLEEGGFDV